MNQQKSVGHIRNSMFPHHSLAAPLENEGLGAREISTRRKTFSSGESGFTIFNLRW